jgi:hypothetical protein
MAMEWNDMTLTTNRRIKRALLGAGLGLLLVAAGCGGGGQSAIGITPATATLDAGQSLSIEASVVNDIGLGGVRYALAGAGALGAPAVAPVGASTQTTVVYTAPASVTGTQTATVTATSNRTASLTATVVITLNPALVITNTTLPSGMVGTPYSSAVIASGGTPALTWTVASGALPAGLFLSGTTGAITGTPTSFGTTTFTVSVTDSAKPRNNVVSQTYSLTIAPRLPVITTTLLPGGVVGTAYSQQLAYTGGNGTTPTFSVASGALPAGLTLSASGLISGTPTTAAAGATYTFGVTVAVGTQTSAVQTLSIVIPALPAVTTTSLANGNIGIPYSQQLTYSGGAGGTVTWSITTGALPAGLTLNTATGVISGTPTTQQVSSFSVAVTVGTQTSAAQALSITVYSLVVTSAATATGEVGLPFGFYLTAQGGTGPYTWSVLGTGSALPAGLSLNATTGLISGTPTTAATTTNVVVQAKDTLAATATQAMTFTINAARGSSNNGELKGQYAFLLSGFDASGNPLAEIGTLTADGNGNITAGLLDSNGTGMSASTSGALTASTFSVGADNRGKLTMIAGGVTRTFVVSLDAVTGGVGTAGYLTEFDGTGQSLTGVLALQTPSAFTPASVTGGYAFGASGFALGSTAAALTHRAVAGEMQFIAGAFASGEMLSSSQANTTPVTPTSGVLTVAANGCGTLALVRPSPANTLDFAVCVVSAGKLFMLSTDAAGSAGTTANDLLSGTMLQQTITNGNFAANSLSGTAVMRSGSLATTSSSPTAFSDARVGLYSFNGMGTVSLAADENKGGTALTDALSGSYSVAANGRVTMSLTAGLGGCTDCTGAGQTFAYLVGLNQGFLMDFTTGASAGQFEAQTATAITNASLNGSYALGSVMPLVQSSNYTEGVFTSAGAGSVTGTIDLNASGSLYPDQTLSASYVTAATGRATFSPAGGDSSVLYVVSPTKVLVLDLQTGNPVVVEAVHQ